MTCTTLADLVGPQDSNMENVEPPGGVTDDALAATALIAIGAVRSDDEQGELVHRVKAASGRVIASTPHHDVCP